MMLAAASLVRSWAVGQSGEYLFSLDVAEECLSVRCAVTMSRPAAMRPEA